MKAQTAHGAVKIAVKAGLALVVLAGSAITAAAQDILLEKGPAPSEPTAKRTRRTQGSAPRRDHYTRYTPPTSEELPADAKIHIIVKGDTLWDLAQSYLGDPYLWPQIWEVNRYITDPHWIFPGDPLIIPQPLLITDGRPVEPPFDLDGLPAPQPVAKRYDVYCSPFIVRIEHQRGRDKEKRAPEFMASEEPKAKAVRASASSDDVVMSKDLTKEEKAAQKAEKKEREKEARRAKAAEKNQERLAKKELKDQERAARKAALSRNEPSEDSVSKLTPIVYGAVEINGEPIHQDPKLRRKQFLRPSDEVRTLIDHSPRLVGSEVPKEGFGDGDVLYINRGERQGVKPGDEFQVIRPERLVYHPRTREKIGIAMQRKGILRVLCTQQDSSTVTIVSSCETLSIGDVLRPAEAIPIPLASEFTPTPAQCQRLTDRPTGTIVYVKGDKDGFAEEDVVSVDLGSESGLVPGDFLLVWRPNLSNFKDLPPLVLGDAVVLLVEPRTATLKIMASYSDMGVGDQVQLR